MAGSITPSPERGEQEDPVKHNHQSLLGAFCLIFLAMLLAFTPFANGQQSAGSVTGLVTDVSGSAIANATVTIRDMDRGTTWTTRTTDAGLYVFPTVPAGRIQVTVEAAGFTHAIHDPFSLALNQVARVDFQLKVTSVSETITVTGDEPLLQSSSTELGTTLDTEATTSLPLATRDTNQLALLAPGVVSPNLFAFESSQNTFGTGRPYVNGAREQDNNSSLDGMDINQPDNNDVAYVPAPDALSEMNIITSNAPADFGNYIGGVIVESLKSGSNQFHGGVYEYIRNTDLDANSWQNKANAYINGFGPATALPRPVLQWNDFGGMIGGPIRHDKLFFFTDFQGATFNEPRTGQTNTTIPDKNFLTGNFASLCTSQGATFVNGVCSNPVYQLYQPAAGTAPGSRAAYANNQVPVTSKVAAAIIASPYFAQEEETLNYFTSGSVHSWQGDAKIDWQPSERDHVMGRYSQQYVVNTTSYGTDVLSPNLEREYPLKNFVVDYDRTITPSWVNEFRLGAQIFPANDQIYTNGISGDLPSSSVCPACKAASFP